MKTRVIAELGSCHMGRWDRLKEAIETAKEVGVDALKLQLFPDDAPFVPPNIWLKPEFFSKAFNYGKKIGLPVSASVFDKENAVFLLEHKPVFVKLAYSQRKMAHWIITEPTNAELIISCDTMSDHLVPKNATKLYCIPHYPVLFEVAFDELFPRFDGFSDHTLGLRQTQRAIDAGALVIEKHVRLGYDDELSCPDGRFSVNLKDLKKLRTEKWD